MKKVENRGQAKKVAKPVSKEDGEWIREIFTVGRRFGVDHRTAKRMAKEGSIKTKTFCSETYYWCETEDAKNKRLETQND